MTATFGLSAADAEKIPKLGHLVWYECTTTSLTYEEVEKILTKHGLDADTFPTANRKKAYHHAVGAYQSEHDRVTVDKVPTPVSMNAFRHQITQVVTVEQNGGADNRLDFDAEVVTAFDKDSESVSVRAVGDDAHTRTVKAKLQKYIDHYMDNVHVDVVRDWLQAEFARCNAVNARKAGGIYFVADNYSAEIEAIENAMAEIGSTLFAHPVFDTQTWRQNAAGFVTDDLVADFGGMKRDLDALVDEAKTTGEIKRFKLETLLGRFVKLESKEGLYEDLLEAKIADLQTGIKAVKKRIAALTLGKVAGIEPVDTAHEIRESARAAKRASVARGKAAKKKATEAADMQQREAKERLAKKLKLSPVKGTRKAKTPTRQTVRPSKKSDVPF